MEKAFAFLEVKPPSSRINVFELRLISRFRKLVCMKPMVDKDQKTACEKVATSSCFALVGALVCPRGETALRA